MPDLSIIIVNYNTREPLRRCLDSIQAERGELAVEVIVVDNGSVDDSPAMVKAFAAQAAPLEVRLIEPGTNTWFTGGNNLGIQAASGDYVLILNPDTVILPGSLQTMLAYLQARPQVGAACCRQQFPDGGEIAICSRAPRFPDLLLGYTFLGTLLPFWRNRRRAQMWYAGWDRRSSRAVEVIPDSCLMAPRPLINDLHGFDETFKLYFTEDEICRRIIGSGHEVHFVAEATILHEEHASTRQVQRLASQVYFDDLIVYTRKFNGPLAALLLRALVAPTRRAMDMVQRLRGEKKTL